MPNQSIPQLETRCVARIRPVATAVTRILGATRITVITGSIVALDHVIIRVPPSSGAMLEIHGDIVEAIPQVMNQRMLSRDLVYQTSLVENMVHTQECIGAMLMPTRIGTGVAVQNHLVTTMVKATNGATLQTVSTSGITVSDCVAELIRGLLFANCSITREKAPILSAYSYCILLVNPVSQSPRVPPVLIALLN